MRYGLERHGPCCPALSWMDSRRVAGFTCGAHLGISPFQRPNTFSNFIIKRKQIFEFRFAFYPTGARIYVLMQPFNGARSVFGIYRSAVSQFAVQHYPGFVSGFTDKKPVARLIDFAE